MYEFAFTITYERGADELADTFITHSSLRSEAIYSCLNPKEMWVLESTSGNETAVSSFRDVVRAGRGDRFSVSGRSSSTQCTTSEITDEHRRFVTFTHVTDIQHCDAVPTIAARYLTEGALFRQVRSGKHVQWRIYVQNDEKIGLVYDTLSARLADGLSFSFDHLRTAENLQHTLFSTTSIRAEQRAVLETAVDMGYFETPREATLDEVAQKLGIPRSTASYRLRRATAELAKSYTETQP